MEVIEEKNSLLIVDDEETNISALASFLSLEYTIYTAKNGSEAITLASNHLPDVILLDILMPDMDGYEIITRLKSMERTKEIPIIFITGLCNAEAEEKGFTLGASDYISKPFVPLIVKFRIQNQMQTMSQIKMMKSMSMTDTLTELPNRRCFDERLLLEWERGKRNKAELTIFFIDIDMFKDYNDLYGHLQGDIALKTVGKIIEQTLNRSTDFVARWGGEEFVVLLPSTDKAGAMKTAENIRKKIEETKISYNSEDTKLTISIGLNTITPAHEYTIMDFQEGADQALYNAKKLGRNRVYQYNEEAEI